MDLETLTDIPNAETIQAIHETEILLNTPNAKKYQVFSYLFNVLDTHKLNYFCKNLRFPIVKSSKIGYNYFYEK